MIASFEQPHRRFNPLTNEWVLVSPHRNRRPWQGKTETPPTEKRPARDPACYLCPGNTRANGETNPAYTETYVFPNDFPALLTDTEGQEGGESDPLFRTDGARGECRVVCFSPRHDLTLAQMEVSDIEKVVRVWGEQARELGAKWRWVQVFENRGEMMGASNPHPHGQIWAGDFLPTLPTKEDEAQREYFARYDSPLLLDYARREAGGERGVVNGEHFRAVVPFWAVWPFETLVLPTRRVIPHLYHLTDEEQRDLAHVLKQLLSAYDRLFDVSFPYSMGWHGTPTGQEIAPAEHWQLHAHFYPPLLRSATVRKFMVGYEMLGESQRDLTAEQAAERLRVALAEVSPAK